MVLPDKHSNIANKTFHLYGLYKWYIFIHHFFTPTYIYQDFNGFGLKGTVAWDGFLCHSIVSRTESKDFNFFILVEFWFNLAYSESAPRFFNNLRGLHRVNISTMGDGINYLFTYDSYVSMHNIFHRDECITWAGGGEGALDTPGPLNGIKRSECHLGPGVYRVPFILYRMQWAKKPSHATVPLHW